MGDAPDVYEMVGLLSHPHEAGYAMTVTVHHHNAAEVRLHHPQRTRTIHVEDPAVVTFLQALMSGLAETAIPAAAAP